MRSDYNAEPSRKYFFIFSKDLQILTTSRHLIHFNLQIALGLTQIVFLAGGTATHNEVGNLEHAVCRISTITIT
jgi:hypothetical protein